MPKKSRRNRNFVAIPFDTSLGLGTLVDGVVIVNSLLANAFGEDFYAISLDATWAIRAATATEGPIEVGLAHDDLTVGEIKEWSEAELTDPDDIIQKERARRPCRRVGKFAILDTNEVLAQGELIRTKIKFSVGDTHKLNFYAKNASGATLTTGMTLEVSGTLYGRWQR